MKKKKQTDYQALFYMGIILVSVGVVFMASVNIGLGTAFIALGSLYMMFGGKNKDKWKKN